MSILKAKFKNIDLLKTFIATNSDLICFLCISVGPDYFKGDKLNAIIDEINQKFKECIVVIGDTLQRYNQMVEENIDEKTAYYKAQEIGLKWKNDIFTKKQDDTSKQLGNFKST
jgi:hypothetical protein